MPRYYFHLRTGEAVEADPEGTEFPSLEAAVADAHQARLEYLRDEGIAEGGQQRACRFEITDESGRLVATVPRGDF